MTASRTARARCGGGWCCSFCPARCSSSYLVTLPLTTMRLGPADFASFSLVVSMSALAMSLSQMGSGYLLTHRYRGAASPNNAAW